MKTVPPLLVSVLLAAGAQAQPSCSQDPLRPIMRSRVMPPNPGQAHGVTTLEIHIGTDGAPDAAKVIASTVTPEMDEAARTTVMTYWRWQMPTRNCAVFAVTTRVNVAWH